MKIIYVKRNQAKRCAEIVAEKSGKYLIEYEMPNGAIYLNVIQSLNEPDKYKSITTKNALKMFGYNRLTDES